MIHTMLCHSRMLSLVNFDCSVQLSLHCIMKSTLPYSHAAFLYFHPGLLVLMVLYSPCCTWRHANIHAFTLHLVNFVNFVAPYFWIQAHAIIEIYQLHNWNIKISSTTNNPIFSAANISIPSIFEPIEPTLIPLPIKSKGFNGNCFKYLSLWRFRRVRSFQWIDIH